MKINKMALQFEWFMNAKAEQDCSYQGEAQNFPTAFMGLWSRNNITKLNVLK